LEQYRKATALSHEFSYADYVCIDAAFAAYATEGGYCRVTRMPVGGWLFGDQTVDAQTARRTRKKRMYFADMCQVLFPSIDRDELAEKIRVHASQLERDAKITSADLDCEALPPDYAVDVALVFMTWDAHHRGALSEAEFVAMAQPELDSNSREDAASLFALYATQACPDTGEPLMDFEDFIQCAVVAVQ